MNLLVTAGNTLAPIDRVRGLTNVFTGRTGAAVALHAHARGHRVILLTSHPEAVAAMHPEPRASANAGRCIRYRTFDDLQDLMAGSIRTGGFDAVIHSRRRQRLPVRPASTPRPRARASSPKTALERPGRRAGRG